MPCSSFSHPSAENKSFVAVQHNHYILLTGRPASPTHRAARISHKERAMSSTKIPSHFAPIQDHIDRFGLQHTAGIAQDLADAARTVTRVAGRAWKGVLDAMERGYAAELDQRAIEADAFLRRSARY